MVTNLLNRLGNLGVLLIACALLFGGLAGAAVAHRYDTLTTASVTTHQDASGKANHKSKPHHVKPKQSSQGRHDGSSGPNSTETD
jgi:hypothetical protein